MATGATSYLTIPIFHCCFLLWLCQARDTLKPGEDLREAETLISLNRVFELGFFSSGGTPSSSHYLGIWFKNDPNKKPVWVANREYPLLDSSGILSIRHDGNMEIRDRRGIPIIVNFGMLAPSSKTIATLLDSGNFLLKEGHKIVWQSFYYPSDTLLPGMKIGLFNLFTENNRSQYLVSWQSSSVPTTGSFALGLDKYNFTLVKVWHRDGFSRQIGFWDGKRLKFQFESSSHDHNFSYVSKPNEVYFSIQTEEKRSYSWFVLSSSGQIQEYKMMGQKILMENRSICENTTVSKATDCYIRTPYMCQNGETFSEIKGSMPDSAIVSDSVHLGLSDCEILCKDNCSCAAFASFRDDGTGCELYYGEKKVLLRFIGEGKRTIHVRGDTSTESGEQHNRRLLWLVVTPVLSLILPIIVALVCYLRWRNHRLKDLGLKRFQVQVGSYEAAVDQDIGGDKYGRKKDHDLPLLSFDCVATSTNNFSDENKLGEGGFGPVYKGTLLGNEIAVKRLSRQSSQGLEEFKNEVQLISKLQHRNLVRLFGCCIQREEKILIYEYMANKSLDSFLFDPTKKMLLDWKHRFSIIEGIAQGLLYLHKYSRCRIIHRDLKTSNILLDVDMNPKISDFGMARIFGDDEARAKTTRVVGTFGYMSPEYAVHGHFSIKSDVFSFGVIMLEILSGRKIVTFRHSDRFVNLLGYAWDLWKSGKGLEFMDPTLSNTCLSSQFMQCIQVGLLCVQERPGDRPSISDVISMLSHENTNLPAPKESAFYIRTSYSASSMQQTNSLNDVTVSDILGR
ncbi:hypothetical protein F2P56_002725 [Juglans regia]|uniref:Receptor-like serine/threonine-protein kinase n=3 Tax=Juglans regia TaxID=51240 RepID=A0A2I4GAU2_JUGRE|nr:G-type lectin S-receptor-like serine/threonine-protein kinase At1g67520 [Juglans regia]KAF5482134.1 hypothetical protein F2P56_002725 [Juglans regia]